MNHYFFRSRIVVALALALSTVTVALRSMEVEEDIPSSEKLEKTYNPAAGALLIDAAKANQLSLVETALRSQADPNTSDNTYGWTALHYAASSGNTEIIHILLKAGANINAQNEEGSTPLYSAVWARQIEAVKLLLEYGARLDISSKVGITPLHSAVTALSSELTKMLLAAGADIDARSNEKPQIAHCIGNVDDIASRWTPLHHVAAWGESHEVIQVLLDYGANLNSTDCHDRTALDIAKKRLGEINLRLNMSDGKCRKLQYNVEQMIRVLQNEQPLPAYRSVTTTSPAPSSPLPQPQISAPQRFIGWLFGGSKNTT